MLRVLLAIALTASTLSLSPAHAEEPVLAPDEAIEVVCRPEYLWDCSTMLWIANRESSFRPRAVNWDCDGSGKGMICAGLLQVWAGHEADWSVLLDPEWNVERSYLLWLDRGYQPWGF